MSDTKPLIFLDNDCLTSIFGRGNSFFPERGRERLHCLGSVFTLCLTDTVFHTEIVTGSLNPRTGEKYPDEAAKTKWAMESRVRMMKTSNPTGKDRGERSIVEAVDKISEVLRKTNSDLKVFIASDDKFFCKGREGEDYEAIRFTSKDLINLVNRLYNVAPEDRAAVKITPPAPR